MNKRPAFEGRGELAGWDSDPSSDEDSVWSCSDDELDAQTRAAYKCINKHSREGYRLQILRFSRWLVRDGKRSFVNGAGDTLQPNFPPTEDHIMNFFKWLESKKVPWRHHSNPNQKKRLAPGTMVGIACAFKDFYRINLSEAPLSLNRFFSNRNRAYNIKISLEKLEGLYPVDKASMALSSAAYGRLLQRAIEMRPRGNKFPFSVIRHHPLFLKLGQTLCGRSERIIQIRYAFIGSWSDAFRCKVPNSKSDIEGLMSYWKLFYSNDIDPFWCPVLELAVHTACNSLCGDFEYLFPQSYRGAFRGHFDDLRQNLSESDIQFMEVLRHQLTLHSPKRTGISMVNSCEAVHWDQAELRADHKIGMSAVYQHGAHN